MNIESPLMLCLGEAPGYAGARYSGLAFTSEKLLLDGAIPRVDRLDARITNRNKPWSEPSATTVWSTLYDLGIAEEVILFNVFPWHPIGNKPLHSNRTPTKEEKFKGLPYLEELISIYPNSPVVAIGNTAKDSLSLLGVNCTHVRHPAYGGTPEFRSGLGNYVNKG
jgi:uracil-DNA glycosylase